MNIRVFSLSAMLVSIVSSCLAAADGDVIQWNFDSPQEITAKYNMDQVTVADGRLSGDVTWNPYVYLRLPAAEIDARKFTWLTIHMYSSDKADQLAIYYQSPDFPQSDHPKNHACMGGKFPIVKGWATYRLDLTKNNWSMTQTGEESKQWGGPSGRVSSLRIDPGNQANRWLAIDYVKLQTAEAGLQEGVTADPRGVARAAAFSAANYDRSRHKDFRFHRV